MPVWLVGSLHINTLPRFLPVLPYQSAPFRKITAGCFGLVLTWTESAEGHGVREIVKHAILRSQQEVTGPQISITRAGEGLTRIVVVLVVGRKATGDGGAPWRRRPYFSVLA